MGQNDELRQPDTWTRQCPICQGTADYEWDVLDERGSWWNCKHCGVRFKGFQTDSYSKSGGGSGGIQ